MLIYIVISQNGDVEILDCCPRWDWMAMGQIVRSGYVNGGDTALETMPAENKGR